MSRPSLYYYAGGEQIPLEVDGGHVAIDLQAAVEHGLQTFVDAVRPRMSLLPGGRVAVVQTETVTPALREVLERADAIHPVYRAGAARIVAYPEVRVHVDEARRGELLSALNRSGISADVVGEAAGDVVLRPKSGRGADAIALANYVYETVRPEMAQPRFIRIVPRPQNP
jgi:hypothetical protein